MASLMALIQRSDIPQARRRLAQWLLVWGLPRQRALACAPPQQIAHELGSAREVVSHQLKDFEQRSWLALGQGERFRRSGQPVMRTVADAEIQVSCHIN